MHRQDAIYLDQFCPKISNKNWRESLNKLTNYKCIYCGKPSESLDHLHPMSKGGISITSNPVPEEIEPFNIPIRKIKIKNLILLIKLSFLFPADKPKSGLRNE